MPPPMAARAASLFFAAPGSAAAALSPAAPGSASLFPAAPGLPDAVLLAALLSLNLLSFALFGLDKRRAQRGRRRIPERTLLCCAACFGAAGALLAMRLFRHKTKKPLFSAGVPLLLLVQALALLLPPLLAGAA